MPRTRSTFSSGMSAIATLLLDLRPARRRRRPFGPALRRDRDPDRQASSAGSASTGSISRRARPREEIDAVIAARQGEGPGRRSSISKARPTRPTPWSMSRRSPRARDAAFGDGRAPADRDRQHLPRPALGASRCATAPTSRVYSLTKYAGGHSDLVAGGIIGSKDLINTIRMIRNTIGTISDPNTAWMLLRSLETLELRMDPRRRECREGLRIPARPSQGRKRRLSRLPRGRRRARPTSTAAIAPAPARPSRSI